MEETESETESETRLNEDAGETSNSKAKPSLSDNQRARIERNRQKALLLKQSRLATHPYRNCEPDK